MRHRSHQSGFVAGLADIGVVSRGMYVCRFWWTIGRGQGSNAEGGRRAQIVLEESESVPGYTGT
jgi:hypothetical protein